MMIKPICSETDYDNTVQRVRELLNKEKNAEEKNELDVLKILLEKYERDHYFIEFPDPIDAIKFRMEQQGLTQKDMIRYIGSQSKVSEILNHKRKLSINMVRALHKGLGIPAEVLLQDAVGPQKTKDQGSVAYCSQ